MCACCYTIKWSTMANIQRICVDILTLLYGRYLKHNEELLLLFNSSFKWFLFFFSCLWELIRKNWISVFRILILLILLFLLWRSCSLALWSDENSVKWILFRVFQIKAWKNVSFGTTCLFCNALIDFQFFCDCGR